MDIFVILVELHWLYSTQKQGSKNIARLDCL